MSDIKTKALSGVMWGGVERFSMRGAQFLVNLILARLLSPEEFGLIAMLTVFMAISEVFIDGGFSTALIRQKSSSEADFSTVFYINLTISILFYLLLFLSAPYIASFYNQPELCLITRVYTFNLVINSLVAVNKVKLIIAVDFKTQTKISLISVLLSGVIAICCAYRGYGVWALVVQMLLNSFLNVLLSFYYIKWKPRLLFSSDSFKRLFGFGSKLLGASLIDKSYYQCYKLVIGKFFAPANLGLYDQAVQFSSFPYNNIGGVICRVALPVFSKFQDDKAQLLSVYNRFIRVLTFMIFPIVMGVCGISEPLIDILLTSKWSGCVIYLQILCFASLFESFIGLNLNLLFVTGRSDVVLRLVMIKKIVGITVLVISLYWGLIGVCVGRAFCCIYDSVLHAYSTKRILGVSLLSQFKEVSPQLLLSLIIMIIGMIITQLIHNSYIACLTIIVISILFYYFAVSLFKLTAWQDLRLIISKKC